MSKNTLQLEIGGQVRTLRFNMGALVHLNRESPEDPLEQAGKSSIEIGLEDLSRIVYAGLLADHDSKNIVCEFSQKDVLKWCFDLDFEVVDSIKELFAKAYKKKDVSADAASGEGGADTQ